MGKEIRDGNGEILTLGDRVYVYEFDGIGMSKIGGVLLKNEFTDVSEYKVDYDDGESCAVLDFEMLWKED